MSQKITSTCSECGLVAFATDRAVKFESYYGDYPVKLWRYVCACGWIWANELQRQHNDQERRRQERINREQIMKGFK